MVSILRDDQYNPDNGMPWQVKAVGLIGIPGIIALGSFYFLSQDVRGEMRSIKDNLNLHASQTNTIVEQNNKLNYTLENLKRAIDRLCANTARSASERNDCFR